MQLTILIEPVAGGSGFRAQSFSLTAEGATEEEALRKLQELIQDRLAKGAKLTCIQIPPSPHPLLKWAGTWKADDPLIEEWTKAVEEYRQEVEEDPDR